MWLWDSFNYKQHISKKLIKLWCKLLRKTTGTHEIRYSPFTDDEFAVINHWSKPTIKQTLLPMLKNAGIDKKDFEKA
jgi:hypothetical protein